ncbi:hypothetical protein [Yersinia frederiksenii]|uniref:hypothetical protein n=1 Tax=Yersinia frederiksenii TaxID=29484 RepID=UPI0005DE40DB|nr:hypothetical protein [Yersinia frederiksenii]CFR18494.1 Uncharacterised protein [Yersinia frederiksenii]
MIDEGKIISRHEFKRDNVWLTISAITLLLFLIFLILISSLTDSIFPIPSIISILFVIIIAISLSMIVYFHVNNNRKFTYFLYERGVRIFDHDSGNVFFTPFNKIQYIHKYQTGINPNGKINTMAFRTSKNKHWNIIVNNINNAYPLINTIIHHQVIHIGIISLNNLSLGQCVVFDLIKNNNYWLNFPILSDLLNLMKLRWLQMDTVPLSLSAHTLVTIDRIICIEDIFRIEIAREKRHDKIRLFDKDGNILFSLDYSALINADLFIALIEHMIQNRIPAYYE